jgi:hypothetical protein
VSRSHRICYDIDAITLEERGEFYTRPVNIDHFHLGRVNLCTREIPYFSINGSAEWQKCLGAIAYVSTSMPSHWKERGEFSTLPVNIDHFHLRRVNLCTREIPYFSINGSAEWQKCLGAIAYVTTSMPSCWKSVASFIRFRSILTTFTWEGSIYVPERYHISP